MSKECKVARNAVGGSILLMVVLITIMSMTSCGTSYTTCISASVEKTNNYE